MPTLDDHDCVCHCACILLCCVTTAGFTLPELVGVIDLTGYQYKRSYRPDIAWMHSGAFDDEQHCIFDLP